MSSWGRQARNPGREQGDGPIAETLAQPSRAALHRAAGGQDDAGRAGQDRTGQARGEVGTAGPGVRGGRQGKPWVPGRIRRRGRGSGGGEGRGAGDQGAAGAAGGSIFGVVEVRVRDPAPGEKGKWKETKGN